MTRERPPNRATVRGRVPKTQSESSWAAVIRETARLWRKHGRGYDQTNSVVEHVRRQLALAPPPGRWRTVDHLDRCDLPRLRQTVDSTR